MPAMTQALLNKKRPTTVTRPYAGVQAEARRQDRQQRLLAAGLDVFGRQGYHHTTVRDVCDAAGLTERYFYESFKTLRALFDAVHQQLCDEVSHVTSAAQTQAAAHDAPVLNRLEMALRAWFMYLKADPRRAQITLIDASVLNDIATAFPGATVQDFHARLLNLIEMLHPDLAKHGLLPEWVVPALAGALTSLARTWMRSGYALPIDDLLRHSLLMFQGLVALH